MKSLFLHSSLNGDDEIPLDEGRWAWNSESGHYFLDRTAAGFELSDGLYSVLEVDGNNEDAPHHCAVMDALEPVFKGQQTSGSFTVDGISYSYEVK
jgi:hypothetical protein